MVTVPQREASEIAWFQGWLNGEESLNFPFMRRTLVLTDETARHPFRASLPPHVRMGVEPRTSLRWRLGDLRDAAAMYSACFVATTLYFA